MQVPISLKKSLQVPISFSYFLSQSEFLCKKCGLEINADENAAINIQWVGTTRNALGGCSLERQ
ncbi:MAG: transposase [Oligoflexia bacterium]|nr:transposase [Oligoflexia bacterium]